MPKSLPPSTRRAIIDFDPHAPGAVSITEFCHTLNISRKTYYAIKQRFADSGLAALHPHPRAPHHPASAYTSTTIDTVLAIRERLGSQGWDNGPCSIRYQMIDDPDVDLPIPSRSTIARILANAGMVNPNPRKRPRFRPDPVYPRPRHGTVAARCFFLHPFHRAENHHLPDR